MCPGRGRRCRQPRPGIAPARNDSKTRDRGSGGQTTAKAGFEACRFFPELGQTRVSEPGAGGAEPGGGAGLPTRGSPRCCLLAGQAVPGCPGLSRGQGRPPKCHQRHLGPEGRGVAIFPSCPLEEKDVFLCCLAFVLKMSSESLGGRGEL